MGSDSPVIFLVGDVAKVLKWALVTENLGMGSYDTVTLARMRHLRSAEKYT